MSRASRAAVAAAMLAGLLPLAGPSSAGAAPPPGPQLRELVRALDGPGAAPGATRYDDLGKLDAQTQALAAGKLADPLRSPDPRDTEGLTVTPGGQLMVDVYVNGPVDAASRQLQAEGMDVVATSDREPQRIVSGWLPAAAAPDVAALDATRGVLAVPAPRTATGPGSVLSAGDAAMNGPAARAGAPQPRGAGVTVGVISDSFDRTGHKAAAQASSDLPATTTILDEGPTTGTNDEGQAMAELVYDTAPELSRILFATGFGGSATSKATNIRALVDAGAKVITDDVTYPGEPFFQDFTIDDAVDYARNHGVAYFAAAGNSARHSWEGTYVNASGFNDFAGGDTTQSVGTVPPGKTLNVMLQWDESWGLATDRFTATLGPSDASIAASVVSGGVGIAGSVPRIYVTWKNTTGSSKTATLRLQRTVGAVSPRLKYMIDGDYNVGNVQEHDTQSPTVGPDAAAAANALSVAAVPASDLGRDTAEGFSSRGPVTHYFNRNGVRLATPLVRAKPDLAAPDGANTTLSTFSPFYGTSAASPAAAGVAALLFSANPGLPVSSLVSVMTNPANTVDCLPTVGVDADCGAGFLLADRALADIDPSPPVVSPTLSPATPDGAGGWYTGNVSLTWSTGDLQSPVSTTGCGPVSFGDGVQTVTCTATSGGGTTSVPVTVRRDASPPTIAGITGILPGTYAPSAVPPASAIACSASDPTSGSGPCVVSGYDASIGTHQLTASATNGAGLTATSTLTYTVSEPVGTSTTPTTTTPVTVTPAAARSLTLTRRSLATLRSRGARLSVVAAKPRTRLVVTLKAKLPGARRATTIGARTTTVSSGKRTVTVKLTKKAAAALRRSRKVAIAVTVVATASGARKATLTGRLTVRR